MHGRSTRRGRFPPTSSSSTWRTRSHPTPSPPQTMAVAAAGGGAYGRREVVIRVNGLDTSWGLGRSDRGRALGAAAAVLLPKVDPRGGCRGPRHPRRSRRPRVHGAVVPWSRRRARTVLTAAAIAAASPRVGALVMGTSDLAKDLGARPTRDRLPLATSLGLVVLAARAHGRVALDGVHLDLDDEGGFIAACRQGRDMGFEGKTLIHPKQIDAANAAFGPSAEEIAGAPDHRRPCRGCRGGQGCGRPRRTAHREPPRGGGAPSGRAGGDDRRPQGLGLRRRSARRPPRRAPASGGRDRSLAPPRSRRGRRRDWTRPRVSPPRSDGPRRPAGNTPSDGSNSGSSTSRKPQMTSVRSPCHGAPAGESMPRRRGHQLLDRRAHGVRDAAHAVLVPIRQHNHVTSLSPMRLATLHRHPALATGDDVKEQQSLAPGTQQARQHLTGGRLVCPRLGVFAAQKDRPLEAQMVERHRQHRCGHGADCGVPVIVRGFPVMASVGQRVDSDSPIRRVA